jgi:hypothetical protein
VVTLASAGRLLSVNVGADVYLCGPGSFTHRPDPLEPSAPDTALICCSQPRDAVTLDL